MDPTVEEVHEGTRPDTEAQGSGTGNPQFSWPEICSRHETVLSSHLDMLNSVKNHILTDGDAFRTVALMMEKTNKLVTQFKVVKKQLINRPNAFANMLDNSTLKPEGHQSTTHAHTGNTDPTSAANHSKKKKRSRRSQESMNNETDGPVPVDTTESSHKRKRLDLAIPGNDEDARNATPAAMETEDISDEVQRRLKIKEEQRKKRHAKPEKRKRDSLASNGSSSAGERPRPKKKKMRTSTRQEDLPSSVKDKARRRESDHSEPNSSTEARAKRQKSAT